MEVGYSTPQLKALMWCLRSALSVLTTSMSMMSKRTRMSPSGELPASQDAAAISRSLRLTLPPSNPPSPCSVAISLLLKFEIAHDDLRLFAAGPFGLPCDPEDAQVLAEGKESSENPAGPEFCAAKVFRALPEEPGSERAWRSQGRRRRTSWHGRSWAPSSGGGWTVE